MYMYMYGTCMVHYCIHVDVNNITINNIKIIVTRIIIVIVDKNNYSNCYITVLLINYYNF